MKLSFLDSFVLVCCHKKDFASSQKGLKVADMGFLLANRQNE